MIAPDTITASVRVLQVTHNRISIQPRGGGIDSRCWIKHEQLVGPVPIVGDAEITIPAALARVRGIAR